MNWQRYSCKAARWAEKGAQNGASVSDRILLENPPQSLHPLPQLCFPSSLDHMPLVVFNLLRTEIYVRSLQSRASGCQRRAEQSKRLLSVWMRNTPKHGTYGLSNKATFSFHMFHSGQKITHVINTAVHLLQ